MNFSSRPKHRRLVTEVPTSRRALNQTSRSHELQNYGESNRIMNLLLVCVLAAAIFLNPILSTLNAHVLNITSSMVIASQLGVTLAGAALLIKYPPKVASSFFVALGLIFLAWVIASIYNGYFTLKSIYDISIIPLFILLGASATRIPIRFINVILGLTLFVGLLEAFFPDLYIRIFNPLDYYRATREWAAVNAAGDSGLYYGSNRAGGTWFSFISTHRVGSIFLEPLSLGYFAIVCTLIYSVVYRHNMRNYLIGALLCLLLSLLSDSRLATALIFLLLIFQVSRIQLPLFIALYAMPVLMLITSLIYLTGLVDAIFPDGTFRLSITFAPLFQANVVDIVLGGVDASKAGDSGVIYLISSFGLVGTILAFYLFCGFIGLSRWRYTSYIPLFVAIYANTVLLFGGALFSIKTAALLGFLLGVVGATDSIARTSSGRSAHIKKTRPPLTHPDSL